MLTRLGLMTVRARLLALMVLIVIPIAGLSVVFAFGNYQSILTSIESERSQAVSDFAVRTDVWVTSVLRTVFILTESIQAQPGDAIDCYAVAAQLLYKMEGYNAIAINNADGRLCFSSRTASITQDLALRVLAEYREKPHVRLPFSPLEVEADYGPVRAGNERHLAIYERSLVKNGSQWESLTFVDPSLLDRFFELGSGKSMIVALMSPGLIPMAVRGAREDDMSWLPQAENIVAGSAHWRASAQGGKEYDYTTEAISNSNLYILARFDDKPRADAWFRFVMLVSLPVLMLAALFASYAHFVRTGITKWISGIEQAARARTQGKAELAPIGEKMPADIRSVALAFNDMIDESIKRESALSQSLASNRFLNRELHHRLKNSLQVIQSYMSLSRRQQGSRTDTSLAEMEAKVLVLSVAYRLALTDNHMQPVPLKPFTEEIIFTLASALNESGRSIDAKITSDAGLAVDRAIPLGLVLVDAIMTGFKGADTQSVSISLEETEDGRVELQAVIDGTPPDSQQPSRIMKGLAGQLQGEIVPTAPGGVIRLRFHC